MSDENVPTWQIKETKNVRKWKAEDGCDMINEYAFLETIGYGVFGKVKLAERRVGEKPYRLFAIKILHINRLSKYKEYRRLDDKLHLIPPLQKIHGEIEIMRHLFHRNIVLLFEVVYDSNLETIWMIMEYMKNGPCMKFNGDSMKWSSPLTGGVLTEKLAWQHLYDITSGLEYLHSKKIAHRDIKLDNILLSDDGRCHLSDFGCSRKMTEDMEKVIDTAGTFCFLAPECCSGEPYCAFKADIWAMGICLYVFLFGKLPFEIDITSVLFEKIQNETLEIQEDHEYSEKIIQLLKRILDKEPNSRITLQEILLIQKEESTIINE